MNAEDDQQELFVQVEYDGKKLEVLTPKSAGITLFEHWTRHALGAFIASYAFQKFVQNKLLFLFLNTILSESLSLALSNEMTV